MHPGSAFKSAKAKLATAISARLRPRPIDKVIEAIARVGYGAQGFVYVSAGVLTLLAALDLMAEAAGSQEATFWIARQPLGRVWLVLLGLGLLAFALWCVLQSVFDADNEGHDRQALMRRAGQGANGLVHAALAITAFGLVFRTHADLVVQQQAQVRNLAATLLAVPFGDALLIAIGAAIVGTGLANLFNGLKEDFTDRLSCSDAICRRLAPLAKAGTVARGMSLIPLGLFICIGGIHARPTDIRTFGAALDGLGSQPGGAWILGVTGLGLIAFGLFSFIEARFRRIRLPRTLSLT